MSTKCTTSYATDSLVSLASKLPHNLVINQINEQLGAFTISFLFRLRDNQLETLRKKASQKNEYEPIEIKFYSTTTSSAAYSDFWDFSNIDWNKIPEISIGYRFSEDIPDSVIPVILVFSDD